MTNEDAKRLIEKYNLGECNAAEHELINNWYQQLGNHSIDLSDNQIEDLTKEIYKELPSKNRYKKYQLWSAISTVAAACVITIGTWLYTPKPEASVVSSQSQDVSPGKNTASVKLANGKIINLKVNKKAIVISSNQISYVDGGSAIGENSIESGSTQTLTTPRGGEYQIILSDRTKVWLNAGSSMEYPTLFAANIRKVKLKGEAYFEVTKDMKRPFIVSSNKQEILVLGTQFNINAYPEKAIETTLLEGSVKVTANGANGNVKYRVIKPGEQITYVQENFDVKKVDVDLAVAWKNGKTQFEDAELRTVMDMLSRWYNIDVIYQYYPKDSRFTGSISRLKNLSDVLHLLESTQEVHFSIHERKVTVMK